MSDILQDRNERIALDLYKTIMSQYPNNPRMKVEEHLSIYKKCFDTVSGSKVKISEE